MKPHPFSRRRGGLCLALPALIGLAVLLSPAVAPSASLAQSPPVLGQNKFVDALPLPPVIQPDIRRGNRSFYEVRMLQSQHQAHSLLPATTIWGYNGMWPGPTFEVRRNEKVHVR
jgi:FtsP/CotA-like multicopper oxidase with cupredoxin domain